MIPFFKKNYFAEELEDLRGFYQGENVNVRENVVNYFTQNFNLPNFYLTKSCTQSLELSFMSLDLPKGSEVIMPSYGFISIANAVVLNGLKCVFVDCDPDTMNISTNSISNALSDKTSAIITINYGGIACDYDEILKICKEKNLFLVEDNAHGIRAKYKGENLGNFGDISTISFDFLKNVSCNEGGGMSINNEKFFEKFIQSYHFGTNRIDFLNKRVDSYEWKRIGSNNLIGEPLAIILNAQLKKSELIVLEYLKKWNLYYEQLVPLQEKGVISLAKVPSYANHNGHIFWLKTKDITERNSLMKYLKSNGIDTAFHYTPLHTSEFGRKSGEFRGEDVNTTKDSQRILRLPLYFQLEENEQLEVVDRIFEFYNQNK